MRRFSEAFVQNSFHARSPRLNGTGALCIGSRPLTSIEFEERKDTTAAQGTSDTTALSSNPFLIHLPTPTCMSILERCTTFHMNMAGYWIQRPRIHYKRISPLAPSLLGGSALVREV